MFKITVCNTGFSPDGPELNKAKDIVKAFRKAGATGVVSLGNKMVDKPVVARALRVVESAIKLGILKP